MNASALLYIEEWLKTSRAILDIEHKMQSIDNTSQEYEKWKDYLNIAMDIEREKYLDKRLGLEDYQEILNLKSFYSHSLAYHRIYQLVLQHIRFAKDMQTICELTPGILKKQMDMFAKDWIHLSSSIVHYYDILSFLEKKGRKDSDEYQGFLQSLSHTLSLEKDLIDDKKYTLEDYVLMDQYFKHFWSDAPGCVRCRTIATKKCCSFRDLAEKEEQEVIDYLEYKIKIRSLQLVEEVISKEFFMELNASLLEDKYQEDCIISHELPYSNLLLESEFDLQKIDVSLAMDQKYHMENKLHMYHKQIDTCLFRKAKELITTITSMDFKQEMDIMDYQILIEELCHLIAILENMSPKASILIDKSFETMTSFLEDTNRRSYKIVTAAFQRNPVIRMRRKQRDSSIH